MPEVIKLHQNIAKNPLAFIQKIYQFIGVDDKFVPSSLNKKFNSSFQLKSYTVERLRVKITRFMECNASYKINNLIRKINLNEYILHLNNKKGRAKPILSESKRNEFKRIFENEIKELEKIIGRQLPNWR